MTRIALLAGLGLAAAPLTGTADDPAAGRAAATRNPPRAPLKRCAG
jgi:hypothetical protein